MAKEFYNGNLTISLSSFRKGLPYYKFSYVNWPALILIGIVAIALIAFLAMRNVKDEKKFEDQLKNDYRKPVHDKEDAEADEVMK